MNEPDEWPELLTVREVSAILRVSKMTVYRLVKDGHLKSTRAGVRSIRVTVASMRSYLGLDISAPIPGTPCVDTPHVIESGT
jgi:excisionase family DNA binding protein